MNIGIKLNNIDLHKDEKITYLLTGKQPFVGTSKGRIFYYVLSEEKFRLCEDGIVSRSPVVSIISTDNDTRLLVEYENSDTANSSDGGYTWSLAGRGDRCYACGKWETFGLCYGCLGDLIMRVQTLEQKLDEIINAQ